MMKLQRNKVFALAVLLIGVSVTLMFARREKEELVTESKVVASHHEFDKKMAKIPYETATFGMG